MFAALGFIVLMIFTLVIGGQLDKITTDKQLELAKDLAFTVQSEIALASSVEDGYYREFEVPDNLEGYDYIIENTENQVIVKIGRYTYVVTTPQFKGLVVKGNNIIKKPAGDVLVGDITGEDEDPPLLTKLNPVGAQPGNELVLNVTTDEKAFCKYSATDSTYFAMEDYFDDADKNHTKEMTLAGGSYSYYYKCIDLTGNIGSASVTFSTP